MTTPTNANEPQLKPLHIGRSALRGVREGWEHLGLVCATSLTVFALTAAPLLLVVTIARSFLPAGKPLLLAIAVLVSVILHGPLFAAAHLVAHKAITRDEPSYSDFWAGFRRLAPRALVVSGVQWSVSALLIANLVFFAGRTGTGFKVAGALYIYILLGWLTMALYQWPLLIASSVGIIKREDGSPARISSVFRNSLMTFAASPSASLLLLLVALAHSLAMLTGVGAAMLGAGFHAIVATRLTREQLVRFGVLAHEPDPTDPVPDAPWQVPKA